MTDDKKLKDFTFEELRTYCCWMIMETLTTGETLRGCFTMVYSACVQWHEKQPAFKKQWMKRP